MSIRRLTVILLIIIAFYPLSTKSQTSFGIDFGLATPNDEINNVYNKSYTDLGNFLRQATKLGYHLGVNLRLGMSSNIDFIAAIGWNRFPESEILLLDPNTKEVVAKLNTTQNIIPISGGINFYLVRSVIGVYGSGELTYNYISSTVDYIKGDVGIPLNLDKTPTDSRVGFGIGAGVDIDARIMTLNIELKYHYANLIGRVGDEKTKSYLNLKLGIYF